MYGRRRYKGRRKAYRRPFKSRGYLRRSGLYGKFSGQLARQRGLRPEFKFHDANTSLTLGLSSTAPFLTMNLVPQGVASSSRLGSKFTIRSFQMKGTFITPQNTGGAVSTTQVRQILFTDSQTNGALPAILDLLEGSPAFNSLRSVQNAGRFKILFDRQWVMRPKTVWDSTLDIIVRTENKVHKGYYKKMNLVVHMEGSSGVQSEVRQNSLILCTFVDATTLPVSWQGQQRIRFTDT